MALPRRCAKPTCNKLQPCPRPGHQRGWTNLGPNFRPLPHNWDALKAAVVRRDGEKCSRCERRHNLELDHVIERSDGGTDDLSNLRLLCKPCHKDKTDEAKRQRRKKKKR